MSIQQFQDKLRAAGFDPGPSDGKLGAHTYQAFAGYLSGGRAPLGTGDHLALNLPGGEVNSRLRLIHFFAQITHESGFRPISESLNYSVAGLLATFSRTRISATQCQTLGRSTGHAADQEGIANTVYGGPWGANNLGNTQPGDGWRFRGRGLIQLTGRSNYRRTAPEFEINPDLVLTPSGSIKAATDFWRTRGLNPSADRDDVSEVTRKINGGAMGLAERTVLTNKAKAIWPA